MRKELRPVHEDISCHLCGRTILKGERAEAYLAPGGERKRVCDLCSVRAGHEGWIRESAHGDLPVTGRHAEPRRSLWSRFARRGREEDAAVGAEALDAEPAPAAQGPRAPSRRPAGSRAAAPFAEPEASPLDPGSGGSPPWAGGRPVGGGHGEAPGAFEPAPGGFEPAQGGLEPPPPEAAPDRRAEAFPRFSAGASPGAGTAGGPFELSAGGSPGFEAGGAPGEHSADAGPEALEPWPDAAAGPSGEPAPRAARGGGGPSRDGAPGGATRDGAPGGASPSQGPGGLRERLGGRRKDSRHVRAVPTNAQVKVQRALELFNASEHTRTIAGIGRSLGEPWVSAMPLESPPSEVVIVVAWELSWYRYRVDLGDADQPILLLEKGEELDQLDGSLRAWNAAAAPDGRLVAPVGTAP